MLKDTTELFKAFGISQILFDFHVPFFFLFHHDRIGLLFYFQISQQRRTDIQWRRPNRREKRGQSVPRDF